MIKVSHKHFLIFLKECPFPFSLGSENSGLAYCIPTVFATVQGSLNPLDCVPYLLIGGLLSIVVGTLGAKLKRHDVEKEKKLLGILLAITSLLIVGVSDVGAQGQKYHYEREGFSITVPLEWKIEREHGGTMLGQPTSLLLYAASPWESDQDQFSENLVINVAKESAPVNLHEALERSTKFAEGKLADFRSHSNGKSTIRGQQVVWEISSHIMSGVRLKVLTYMFAKEHLVYILTFTAEASKFPAYENQFRNIVQTFHFDKPPHSSSIKPARQSKVEPSMNAADPNIVNQILTESPFSKITEEQVDSVVKKQGKAALMLYAVPENVGLSSNSRNNQGTRLAELYKKIAPDYPNLKFYTLEVKNKSDLDRFAKKLTCF